MSTLPAKPPTLSQFYRVKSRDLFEKCRRFQAACDEPSTRELVQALYRLTLTSGLDHRITVRTSSGLERELICFDSNSYLHLHRHPRVVAEVRRVLDAVGYGTPSAQLLCGTNRYLLELEETISQFHGREDTVVFSSGYAANLGTISALVREGDLVVRDRRSHTSVHDGCRASASRRTLTFPHQDCEALDRLLVDTPEGADVQGKLIVTDGVFSMHGAVAPLPELTAIAQRRGAYLMVDEAHATGIIGETGRGTEELFGLAGAIDILMGTFSKAPGTVGGYVTGNRELVNYLRFYAHSAMFTAAMPAALCAGVAEAFRVMDSEPEHREQLWRNVRSLASSLQQVGMSTPESPESAIIPVFMGDDALLWRFGGELLAEGIKTGVVAFPAVPQGEAMIRLTVNARHTPEDLARTVDVFERLGRAHGILGKSHDEIRALGRGVSLTAGRPASTPTTTHQSTAPIRTPA